MKELLKAHPSKKWVLWNEQLKAEKLGKSYFLMGVKKGQLTTVSDNNLNDYEFIFEVNF